MKKIMKTMPFLTFCLIVGGTLSAQTEEELLDQLILGDRGETVIEGVVSDEFSTTVKSPFSLTGFGSVESDLSLEGDSFTDNSSFRNEGRIKIKPVYERDGVRAYADLDFFVNSGGNGESRQSNSLECVEAYVEGSSPFIWKVGKQRFNWGAGDAYQPTDLLDQPDLRNSFMRDNDDRYSGVFALSLKFLIGDFALEAAVRPVTEESLVPAGFFASETGVISTGADDFTIRFQDSNILTGLDSLSAGLRFGGTAGAFDWHLTGYSGMNREILYRVTLCSESSGYYMDFQPVYKRMNAVGVDVSFAVSKLNMRLEGIYSPDMPALSSYDNGKFISAVTAMTLESSSIDLQTIKHRSYYNYTVGFDVNLWGDSGMIYMEWMQSRYVNEKDIEPILLTDMLLVRIEDSLFGQSLNLTANAMISLGDSGPGLGINGECEYDFKNGLSLTLGAYVFVANGNEYIELAEGKELAYLNVKYYF